MKKFAISILRQADETWAAFETDWSAQCDEVGELFSEYASDSISTLRKIADENGTQPKINRSEAVAVFDEDSGHFLALAMVNRAQIPGKSDWTLRVRHLIVAPLLDFGADFSAGYADVIIAMVSGIIQISETNLMANHLSFHLRSPEDVTFFRALGASLGGSNVFKTVETRGAWLYITKT
jgi:hypothetical protein